MKAHKLMPNPSKAKWVPKVTDDFKQQIMHEYKVLVTKLHDARLQVADLEPRYLKLVELAKLYRLEEEIEAFHNSDEAPAPEVAKSKMEVIQDLATQYFLTHQNEWTRLSDLYEHLANKGVQIGGKNPNSTLSAHLSNSGRFEGDRTRGWRMKADALAEAKATPAERVVNKLAHLIGPSDLVRPEDNSRSPEGPMRR